jgi:hypothetical protein
MNNTQLQKILDMHSIRWELRTERLYAMDVVMGSSYRMERVDVTGFSREQILRWLGY